MIIFWIVLVIGLIGWIITREAIAAKKRIQTRIDRIQAETGSFPDELFARLRYMDQREYEQIVSGKSVKADWADHAGSYPIDELTWNDLELDKVFQRVNYTHSYAGCVRLYEMLKNPSMHPERLTKLEKIMEFFHEYPQNRVDVQFLLDRIGYGERQNAEDCFRILDETKEMYVYLEYVVDFALIGSIGLFFFSPSIGGGLFVFLLVYQLLRYFGQKAKVSGQMQSATYLLSLIEQSEQIYGKISAEKFTEVATWLKTARTCKRHSFWLKQWKNINGSPLGILADYVRMFFHLDLISFAKLRKMLLRVEKELRGLESFISELDAGISILMYRLSLKSYCVPQMEDGRLVDLECTMEGMTHPLLTKAVPNDLFVPKTANGGKGTLITGSNASGKSTYLKTVAINIILAQAFHTVLGTRYKAPFMEVYTSMSVRDSITLSESYYMAETRAVKRILDRADESGHNIVCMIDEVLRGTNTIERIAASAYILKRLSEYANVLCFAATHDIELTSMLTEYYQNVHFEEKMVDGDIYFSYKLCPGAASSQNAIRLLGTIGFPQYMVQQAKACADRFIQEGNWVL